MRVVVTGATGNVGTAVVRALEADGAIREVVALSRRGMSMHGDAGTRVTYAAADVAHDDLGPWFDGADAVVHLAWKFQPVGRPLVTWETNVLGTERVLDAAAAAGVGAVVHASSVGVYSPGPADDHAVDESWPTHALPTSSYGREKAYAERLVDAFEARYPQVRVVRLRPAFTFQTAAAAEQRRIFAGPLVPDVALRPGMLPVLPLPARLRLQAVHADDVADAYRRAVRSEVRGAFNVAADPVLDRHDLGALLATRTVEVPRRLVRAAVAAGWHAHVVPVDAGLLDLFLSVPVMDSSRARMELEWRPARDARDALQAFVQGLQRGAGGAPPIEGDGVGTRVGELRGAVGRRDPAVTA